jgi:hypothetical protein
MDWIQEINHDLYKNINDQLLHKINTTKNINNIQVKIAEQENNYIEKIKKLKKIIENKNIVKSLDGLTVLEILQKELEIIKLISKFSLQNNNVNKHFLIDSLNLILRISNFLQNKLNQKEILNIKQTKVGLVRCSYKFCTFKENCVYNYQKKNNHCYQDHFVHNMVSHDINIILEYINQSYDNEEEIKPNKEILKSLNTLSFVINHMEQELKAKCIYLDKNEWDKFHIYKPIKK